MLVEVGLRGWMGGGVEGDEGVEGGVIDDGESAGGGDEGGG